ncbi:hypothetical protein [Chromobacterium sp. ASV23]|uniref:hypothetical protein n=1 Tax=Chromobacterium sp. ASV23 TaxID=2795110 RepID=UPI0018EAD5CD|nr:hypothetical protein [Chromobacterium sp. ASV23]
MTDLDALLAELTAEPAETAAEAPAPELSPAEVEALATEAEGAEAQPAVNAKDVSEPPVAELDLDALLADVTAESTAPVVEPAPSGKKGGKKAAKKAEKAEPTTLTADPESAETPAEQVKKVRQYFAKKTDRIAAKLGANLADFTLLELPEDGELTPEYIEQSKNTTIEIIDGLGVKPQQRATLLIEWLAGKQTKLNDVIKTAFELLHKDGVVQMGVGGNLMAALGARYSQASARAMGGNTLLMLKALKVLQEDGTANERSVILAVANEKLGLAGEMAAAA